MAGIHCEFEDIQSSLTRLLQHEKFPQPDVSCLVVGFSGGVDSTVLLYALCAKPPRLPVHAVYVNHGLSPLASQWQAHCESICNSLGVPFSARNITVSAKPRQSLEADARDGRYHTLLNYCATHRGALLLGQHQDDQAETFLLQAKRGAGPKGLSAMPAITIRDGVPVLRPMLHMPQSRITRIAQKSAISWIEDESNEDNRFDRNFLRNTVMPSLQERWPGIAKTLSRSAGLCAQQQQLLEEVADEKLTSVMEGDAISIALLQQHSAGWQQQIIRAWFSYQNVPMPGESQLEQVQLMCAARNDAQPVVSLGGWEVRRYADKLSLVKPLCQPPQEALMASPDEMLDYPWSASAKFSVNQTVRVLANMPAVQCRMNANSVSKPLKKWMKEWQIPAWERKHLPVLFIDQQPIAVVTGRRVYYFTGRPDGFEVTLID